MDAKKQDRRVVRTKKQIRQAMIELLAEKSENEISVRELTQRAGINRGTFYIHYNDTNDLLEALLDEASQKLLAVCRQNPPTQTPRNSYPFLTALFSTLRDDAPLFEIMLGAKGSHTYSRRICTLLQENFVDDLVAVFYSSDPRYRQFASGYIVAGCLHQAVSWLQDGAKETPEEMALMAGHIIMHGIDALGPERNI